jgi:hypothetical protein
MRPPVIPRVLPVQKEIVETKYPLNLGCVHVAIDPASHATGIAVFTLDGKYIDSFTVKVNAGIIPTMRLYFMRKKFTEIWTERYGVNCVANLAVIEHMPPGNSAILQTAGGAILSSGKISADMGYSEYVSVQSWKFFCRSLGCHDKSPKGISALKAIGWSYPLPSTDDEADAILLYLTSRWRKKMAIWLGDNGNWLQSWYEQKPKQQKQKKERICKKKKVSS